MGSITRQTPPHMLKVYSSAVWTEIRVTAFET